MHVVRDLFEGGKESRKYGSPDTGMKKPVCFMEQQGVRTWVYS